MIQKILTFTFALFLFSPQSGAFSEVAVSVGANTTEVSPDSSSISADSGMGYFVGILGFMEMQDAFWIRAGATIGQRSVEFKTGTLKIDYDLITIEAPITGLYMFNDMVGAFGGLRVGIVGSDKCSSNVSTSCSTSTSDFETLIYAAEIGGHFRFTPNFGAEVAYNIGLSDIEKSTAWDGGLIISGFMIF